MNKIYNNLNIDNLIETQWGNQFNKHQKECIKEGLKNNIDVSVYAKPHFPYHKMFAIRKLLGEGLEEIKKYVDLDYDAHQLYAIADDIKANKDVSIYVKPEYNWKQCEVIRKGLYSKNNIDVSLYAKPEFSPSQMEQLRLALEDNVDITKCLNSKYKAGEMKEIILGLKTNIDMLPYVEKKFSVKQLTQIRLGLYRNVDISLYAKKEYKYKQMEQIR